jgi:Tol biopolymer transport system component
LGLIAYVGKDGNIYTTDRDGKLRNAITQDADLTQSAGQGGRIYQFPTWAPDGQRLAFIRFTSSQSGPEASVWSVLSDGKKQVQAFNSQDTLPFYMFWAPNSQSITFLGSDPAGQQAQYLVPAAGGESKFLSTGQPYFWDWSPDNNTLVVHIGGASSDNPDARITFIHLDGAISQKELDLKPGFFQAPAWSPAGDALALATQNESGQEELVITGPDGKTPQVLASLNGPTSLAWSPKGGHLAFSTQVQADSGLTTNLVVLDSPQAGPGKQVAPKDVVAFFWSPDGKKIAFFVQDSGPAGGPSGMHVRLIDQAVPGTGLAFQVYDLASGNTSKAVPVTPTDSFQQVLTFNSQYQRSSTIWSPDSLNLVLAGVDSAGANSIFVVSADGSQNHKIADGDLAFWSWK